MKVEEIMTRSVRSLSPYENLSAAAHAMWESDCGIVPVVDENAVVGVITDRDICMAVAKNHHNPHQTQIREIIGGQTLYTCLIDDAVEEALRIMRENQIRRIPAVNKDGKLEGIVSMNDIVLAARKKTAKKAEGLPYETVMEAFKSICEHHHTHRPTASAA